MRDVDLRKFIKAYALLFGLAAVLLMLDNFFLDQGVITILIPVSIYMLAKSSIKIFGVLSRGKNMRAEVGYIAVSLLLVAMLLISVTQLRYISDHSDAIFKFVHNQCGVDDCNRSEKISYEGLEFSEFQGRRFTVTRGFTSIFVVFRVDDSGCTSLDGSRTVFNERRFNFNSYHERNPRPGGC